LTTALRPMHPGYTDLKLTMQYAIAISPPQHVQETVRAMKLQLAKHIGWYNSKNSEAHISFNAFAATGIQLLKLEKYVKEFCSMETPLNVRFAYLASYPHNDDQHTLYLAPNADSKKMLAALMRRFHKQVPIPTRKMNDPHMTIARGISAEHLQAALELWKGQSVDLAFEVNELVLRELDETEQQYFIKQRFGFGGMRLF
jgi:2'-5' RNA ligase